MFLNRPLILCKNSDHFLGWGKEMDLCVQIKSDLFSAVWQAYQPPTFQFDEWLTECCSYQINFALYKNFKFQNIHR